MYKNKILKNNINNTIYLFLDRSLLIHQQNILKNIKICKKKQLLQLQNLHQISLV